MVLVGEGNCPECGDGLSLVVDQDLSEMYMKMFKKALDKFDYQIRCQKCDKMVDPDFTIKEE